MAGTAPKTITMIIDNPMSADLRQGIIKVMRDRHLDLTERQAMLAKGAWAPGSLARNTARFLFSERVSESVL